MEAGGFSSPEEFATEQAGRRTPSGSTCRGLWISILSSGHRAIFLSYPELLINKFPVSVPRTGSIER